MCKRFIEDLANKIIEKTNLENLTTSELYQINKKAVEVIEKRKKILTNEINQSYRVGNYLIGRSARFSAHISSLDVPSRKFDFYYLHKNVQKPFCFRSAGLVISPFLTKEELVNHICLTIDVEDKQTLYKICLQKITCIRDLVDNFE